MAGSPASEELRCAAGDPAVPGRAVPYCFGRLHPARPRPATGRLTPPAPRRRLSRGPGGVLSAHNGTRLASPRSARSLRPTPLARSLSPNPLIPGREAFPSPSTQDEPSADNGPVPGGPPH